MSSTYAGNLAWPNEVTLPSDGETIDVADVNVPIEGLMDRTSYLKNFALAEISTSTDSTMVLTGSALAAAFVMRASGPRRGFFVPSFSVTPSG